VYIFVYLYITDDIPRVAFCSSILVVLH